MSLKPWAFYYSIFIEGEREGERERGREREREGRRGGRDYTFL